EEHDLLTFELPDDNLPGSDRLSKQILKTQSVIDIVTASTLEVPNGTYRTAGTEWKNGRKSDVVYVPRLSIQSSPPPFLIEVQNVVDETFIQCVNSYCLQIIQLYSSKPVVLVFCISKVTPRSFETEFTPSRLKTWLLEYPCNAWAKVCYMVSPNSTAETALQATSTLDPLLALSRFLIEQQASLFAHTHPSDPTVKHLYHLAMMEHGCALQFEANYANNLHTVCSTNIKLLERSKAKLVADIPDTRRAIRDLNQGITYNEKLKRKYSSVEEESSQSSQSSLEMPEDLSLDHPSSDAPQEPEKEKALVKQYYATRNAQMKWKDCWEKGREMGLFKRYSTAESLRANLGHLVLNKKAKRNHATL
ncbi:uncharacterized protein BYT42DRAFT_500690, partial [Radiomyces spectabilis]|uniref:uncharacterized protein n=1 Tax=Radiomyces spectabilis TaxID=64574 RepID=UPI002220BBCB